MNFTRHEAPRILRRYGIKPRKALGQNFLIDPAGLELILTAAELEPHETVLEVGAGLGVLTNALAERAHKVLAVELDNRIVRILQDLLEHPEKVQVLQADVLDLQLEDIFGGAPYLVVANIPYNITSALIRKFLESQSPPDRLVLTIQKEVAQRATSSPGEMSLFALSIQIYGTPEIMGVLPPGSFFPQPGVESAILRVRPHSHSTVERDLIPWVFRLARAGFAQRRKQLHNSLKAGLGMTSEEVNDMLLEASIDPRVRPQELSLDVWTILAERLRSRVDPD